MLLEKNLYLRRVIHESCYLFEVLAPIAKFFLEQLTPVLCHCSFSLGQIGLCSNQDDWYLSSVFGRIDLGYPRFELFKGSFRGQTIAGQNTVNLRSVVMTALLRLSITRHIYDSQKALVLSRVDWLRYLTALRAKCAIAIPSVFLVLKRAQALSKRGLAHHHSTYHEQLKIIVRLRRSHPIQGALIRTTLTAHFYKIYFYL